MIAVRFKLMYSSLMDTTISADVMNAYMLIRAGKREDAQAILMPIVRANPNMAEAWYMLGLALTDREKSIYAFQQVLRIDPSSQRAQQQIEKLLAPDYVAPSIEAPQPPAPEPAQPTPQLAPAPVMPEPVIATPAATEEEPTKKRSNTPVVLVAATFVICLIGVVILLVFNSSSMARIFPFSVTATRTPAPPRATSTPRPTPLPTIYAPLFHPGACPFEIPLGTRVRCGTIQVPQDRQKNLTDLIELPVVLYQSPKANADAVVFLQGGPGVESIDWSLALFRDYVTPILKDHDMIFFDPRGTGRSKPALDCPELNTVFLDAYYQNRSQDEAFQDFLDVWNKCHERFIAEGVNPAAFNTAESAADVHDIVVALGYKQVNLLGISYGTRLGLTVMRDYPEIVRAAVLDSVVPLEGKMFNRRASDTKYALDKLFADCASNPRCNGAYPDLAYVFNQLIEKFDKTPATIRVYTTSADSLPTAKVNGVDMISAMVAGMHQSELVSVIPKAIYDIHAGDYTFLSYALGARGSDFKTTGLGTYFSTVCPEQVYVTNAGQLDADLNVTPLLKQFALTGLFGSTQNLFELCKAWDTKPDNPQDDLPVTAKNPTLIISGQYDPTTPTTTGEMVAADLPNRYFYVIPGMGHGATIGNACASTIMMAFLAAPEKTPDSTCLTSKPFEFFLPYDGKEPVTLVELIDSVNGVQGLIPAGWKKNIADGSYARHAYLFDVTQVQATAYRAAKSAVLEELKTSFQKSGFSGTPKVMDMHSANGLAWTIYATKFNGEPVIVALASTNTSRTMVLVMVVSAPEREAFYNGLFIPMLDALVPLW